MPEKPVVWFVDDLEDNVREFVKNHSDAFDIKTFRTPQQVLDRLREETPDALLCDIFFYDTQEEAREVERKIGAEAEHMRQVAIEIGAMDEKYLAGIDLIRRVNQRYDGKPPFPLYAYTSKGPYLLNQYALDQLAEHGARLLFKKRYSRQAEEMIITHDVDEARRQRCFQWRPSIQMIIGGLMTIGVVSWIVERTLDYLVRLLTR